MSLRKQLGQAVDTVGNTATEIYALPTGIHAVSIDLECSNVTDADATVRVYQDKDGDTYGIGTALYYDYPVKADSTVKLKIGPMSTASGTLAGSSSAASAVTFTLHGREIWIGVPAILGPGRAREFESGGPDYLSFVDPGGADTPVADLISGASDYSLSAWIKISSGVSTARTIFGMFSSDLNDDGFFMLHVNTNGYLVGLIETDGGVGNSNAWGTTNVRDDTWHHVACSWDGNDMIVFLDGVEDLPPTHTARTFPTVDTIAVGCRVDSTPDQGFEGDIDECSIWIDHLLTESEAAKLHNLGNSSTKRYYINDGKISITETLTFTNATSYISRASGSWVTDGFEVGDIVTIAGSVSNDGAHPITVVTASDLTVSTTITDESTPVSCTARVGEFGDNTITQPNWHCSLSATLNPGDPGKDEIGDVDLTDNGTADVAGIPAGD